MRQGTSDCKNSGGKVTYKANGATCPMYRKADKRRITGRAVRKVWNHNQSAQSVSYTHLDVYKRQQPSTTLDIYSHAFDKNKKLAQEKLAEAMGL